VIKRKPNSIFEYDLDDFAFEGYEPYPGIKAPIAI
jgi:thymidylate synthase